MNQQNQIKQGLEIKAKTDIYPSRYYTLKYKIKDGKKGPIFVSIARFWGEYSCKEYVLKFNKKNQVDDTERNFLIELITKQNQNDENELLDNVIRIFDCIEYEEYNIIIMEKGEEDLLSSIQKGQLTIIEKLQICLDISLPIYYLHLNNLKHCQIIPQNYVKVNDKFKLINFGQISHKNQNKSIPIEYTSPELLDNSDNLSDKVDIWQLGCLFYQIYDGNQLFQGDPIQIKKQMLNHTVDQNGLNKKISQLNCQSDMKDLIFLMLQPDGTKRISITEVVEKHQQIQNPNSILISQKFLNKSVSANIVSYNNNQVNSQQVNDNLKNKNISKESNENSNKMSQDQYIIGKINNQQPQQMEEKPIIFYQNPYYSLSEEQLKTMKDKIEKELYQKFQEQFKAQESKYKEEISKFQNDLNQLKNQLKTKTKQEEKDNLQNEIQYKNEIIKLQNEIIKLQNEKNELQNNKINSQTNFQIEFHVSKSASNLLQQIVEEFDKQSPESKQTFVMQNKVLIDKLVQHLIKNNNK